MDLLELIDDAISSMPKKRMVEIEAEKLTIIGDLHADYEALKIIKKNIVGEAIFLGDYADRGEYPVEVYTEVLNMFLEGKAVLLRGNHESTDVYPHDLPYYLREKFGDEREVYAALQKLWDKMPVSAIVEGEMWLAHGGVPTKGCRIDEEGIKRSEIAKPDEQTMLEIMWNDPWEKEKCSDNWQRGVMYFFGKIASQHLINALDVKVIVRSHEPYKVLKVEQDGMVVTIGSCAYPYGLAEFAVLQVDLREKFRNGYELASRFGRIFSV